MQTTTATPEPLPGWERVGKRNGQPQYCREEVGVTPLYQHTHVPSAVRGLVYRDTEHWRCATLASDAHDEYRLVAQPHEFASAQAAMVWWEMNHAAD